MPNILISGSMAYDYIMDFPDAFKNHILPDQIHVLNVSFAVEKMTREFGGCAGNMAYTMRLLGGNPLILAAVGGDSKEYLAHLKKNKITTKYLKQVKDVMTSAAYITTDREDNQIAAFYLGAGNNAVEQSVNNVKEKIKLALITPTKKDAMIRHAKEASERKTPIVFDPGQALSALSAQELMLLIGQAEFLIANDYEMKLIQERTGWKSESMFDHVRVVITTLGEKGSIVHTKDELFEIKPCPPDSVDDPTGAGDGYRAGFFTAYVNGHDLKTCGQVGSVAATYAVEHYGTQNHRFTVKEFERRYGETYGEKLKVKNT